MTKFVNIFTLLLLLLSFDTIGQIKLEDWKFKTGDNPEWSSPNFNDKNWAIIKGNDIYENQGYSGYNGFSWYRSTFKLPSSLLKKSFFKDSLRIVLAKIDDVDETYLNGVKIGQTGSFPQDPGGSASAYNVTRNYIISTDHPTIKWNEDNVIAIRVYDGGSGGGLWGLTPSVGLADIIDSISLKTNSYGFDYTKTGYIKKPIEIISNYSKTINGKLNLKIEKDDLSQELSQKVVLHPYGSFKHVFEFSNIENAKVTYTFIEAITERSISSSQMTPYLLTPKEKPEPKITNASVYGAGLGKPFLWAIRSTGERPITFSAKGLPKELLLDPISGLITGKTSSERQIYTITLGAKNKHGEVFKQVKIMLGDTLARTPPMGWNSWNCWGKEVSQDRVKSSAEGIVNSGLINYGWTYIVIDGGWQGKRNANGQIQPNEKFPKIKSLADYLHENGLKFGIYSSPGITTCLGLPGSYEHEEIDVKTYANWGVDYLKYDLCEYMELMSKPRNNWSIEEQVLPFRKMTDAIKLSERDIIHSVCTWGLNKAWKWGYKTGGQLWRTSGDIEDSWTSMSSIGFAQAKLHSYSKPGGWNDPDMMVLGWVGWSDKLHQTSLTPTEQYTHVTLWSMAAAPLMLGCDLSRLDDFTYNLLSNDEVIAINQDALGKQAKVIWEDDKIRVWTRPLADGTEAVAIFNLENKARALTTDWKTWRLDKFTSARDVWRQKELGKLDTLKKINLEPHGSVLLKLKN